jgi:hypothetical protein
VDEILNRFNSRTVRYVVIGGQAMRLEGFPRFSIDWDVYIPPHDTANLEKINAALADELDCPVLPLGSKGENFVQTYQTRWGILQFHLAGPGLPAFADAERNAVRCMTENGTEVPCLSGQDLLNSKRAANRPQDQADIQFLETKREAGLL